ncbi:general stress protein [Pseudonocardia xinjiangensis]|uniref:general stress protein n=1 Tax=Pseudonocardia xinjiangensis TaxID=75289 RepID=UPI003D8FE50D
MAGAAPASAPGSVNRGMNETSSDHCFLRGPRQSAVVVDALADRGFPVDRLAIVGAGLKLTEQGRGPRGRGRAMLNGMVAGAVVGAIVGWLLGLLNLVASFATAVVFGLWGLMLGPCSAPGSERWPARGRVMTDLPLRSCSALSATICSLPRTRQPRRREGSRTSSKTRGRRSAPEGGDGGGVLQTPATAIHSGMTVVLRWCAQAPTH